MYVQSHYSVNSYGIPCLLTIVIVAFYSWQMYVLVLRQQFTIKNKTHPCRGGFYSVIAVGCHNTVGQFLYYLLMRLKLN